MTSTPEQRRRYRQKYPDKIRESKRKHLEKAFKLRGDGVQILEGRLRTDFGRLTRLTFDDVLERRCELCGSERDLQIHHKRYVFPIVSEDLMRLCRRCHVEEHQRRPTPGGGETP